MLTAADELHVHQTPEPIAVAGTDRNFYDRSFFGGWTPDGSVFLGVAFGIYPHLNVADAHLTIVRDGVQHCLHASKVLHSDRTTLAVGPLAIDVEEPLHRLRVRVAEHDGLAADLRFTGRHFPVEEPRFMYRIGPRAFMDYTRLTQGMTLEGWVAVDGEELVLPAGSQGVRDRSWGVRPIGAPDPQPPAPAVAPQFFWLWAPTHFDDRCTFWHLNADAHGRPWNTRGVVAADGADVATLVHAEGRETLELVEGTRWVARAALDLTPEGGAPHRLEYEPVAHLEMQGLGYFHPTWGHGTLHGELAVERETIDLSASSPAEPQRLHRQLLCRVRCTSGEDVEEGMGIFEHLLLGRSEPYGLA